MSDETIDKHDDEPTQEVPPNTGIKIIATAIIFLVLGFITLELLITTHLGELAEDLLEDYLPWFIAGTLLTVSIAILWTYRLRK